MTIRRLLGIVSLVALTGAGCASIRGFTATNPKRPATAKDAEIERFVASWNANASKIDSLMCDGVDVSGKAEGKPIPLTAKIGFQQPNKFLMTGSSIGGKSEVVMGSNQEEIWFWIARDPNNSVYFCKREDFKNVNIAMPFHPDWIVDLLGVSAIDEAKYRPDASTPDYFTLVANEKTPTGHDVIKRIVIDRGSGRLAMIQLFDPNRKQKPMVEAMIEKYYEDPASGIFLPSKVRMEWPDSDTKMTFTLPHRNIRINNISPEMAAGIFKFRPDDWIDVALVDIGERSRSAMPVSAQRLPGNETSPDYDPRIRPAHGTRLKGVIETQ